MNRTKRNFSKTKKYLLFRSWGRYSVSSYHDARSYAHAGTKEQVPSERASPRFEFLESSFLCLNWPWSWSRCHLHRSKPLLCWGIAHDRRMSLYRRQYWCDGSSIAVELHFLCFQDPSGSCHASSRAWLRSVCPHVCGGPGRLNRNFHYRLS